MDARIKLELQEDHGFTLGEIVVYEKQIKGTLLYKRLELKYAFVDVMDRLTKALK